jgi:hypothetical protein
MPNTLSLVATAVSEFTLLIQDCEQDSYEYRSEVVCKGESEPVYLKLLLEGDGLSVWVAGCPTQEQNKEVEDAIYDAVRPLPVVKQAIQTINRRADRGRECL